jgi:hypothetical protein
MVFNPSIKPQQSNPAAAVTTYWTSTSNMIFRRLILSSTIAATILCAVLIETTNTVDCFTVVSTDFRSHPLVSDLNMGKSDIDSTYSVKSPPLRVNVVRAIATSFAAIVLMTAPSEAWADGQTKDFKFPPIDFSDVNRCVLKGGSSMGQANAARDKLYDLRQCKLSGVDATGYDLSGVSTY